MATKSIKEMLGNLPVGVVDVVRLFVETVEVGDIKANSRTELITGFRRVVREGVKAVREGENTLPFGEVVERSLEARKERRKSTLADLRSYAGRMVRFDGWAEKPLRGIGVEECREMLHKLFGHSVFAFRKGRAVLHSLFAYGMRQGWCERNPADGVEVPKVVEQCIEPLCLEEVRRLTWEDVDTAEGVVYIPPQHSKTGGARLIPLRGKAATNFPHRTSSIVDRTCPICPCNWAKRWRALRERAGFHHWRPDTLRHTFASMHLRCFANPPQLQAEMGHRDSSLLRTRYVNLRGISRADAEHFWK